MLELVGVLFVFLIIFLFLENIWPENVSRWKGEYEFQTMYNRAQQESTALVESPGYPMDWNPQSVQIVGLSVQKNVLDSNRLQMFSQMVLDDYNLTKHKMKFFEYDFFIEIDSNKDSLDRNIGRIPNPASNTAVVWRNVSLEGQNAIFRLTVFR